MKPQRLGSPIAPRPICNGEECECPVGSSAVERRHRRLDRAGDCGAPRQPAPRRLGSARHQDRTPGNGRFLPRLRLCNERALKPVSGLIFYGCCSGPYFSSRCGSLRLSTRISKGACANTQTIPREELERRVLSGLEDRMMAPETAAETMRAYAEETNRLNREHRSNGDTRRAELAKVEKQIWGIIEAIKAGMFHGA